MRKVCSRKVCSSYPLLAAVAVALIVAGAAAAQAPITMSAGAAQMEWRATVPGSLLLNVSGPDGFHAQQRFAAGEAAVFSAFDASGNLRPAGSYSFEVLVEAVVDDSTRAELDAIRASGDGGALGALQKAGKIPSEPVVQFGNFRIADGAFVYGGEEEPAAGPAPTGNRLSEKAQVFTTDLIVQGSECIGFDCSSSESFGFDTLRLKENNLRIHFNDTSNSASFPSNDWRLVANDTSNGGANYFSIEDSSAGRQVFTVKAGASSNSLYVSTGGKVGFGTSAPVVDLHTVSGNTPTLRLEQNGSSGFTPQTWDVAGNEANFFVRDVTNGSHLSFRIKPGAPESSLFIDASGNIGLGTASPDYDLDIDNGTSSSANFVVRGKSGSMILQDQDTTSGQQAAQNLVSGGTWKLRGLSDDLSAETVRGIAVDLADGDVGIQCASSLTADLTIGSAESCATGTYSQIDAGQTSFTVSSSRAIKEHLQSVEVPDILDRIQDVSVYEYDFIDGPKNRLGLMAEDFHEVFERGSDKLLNGQEIQMALWLAVQELARGSREVEAKDQQIQDLSARVEALEELVSRLSVAR